MWERPPVGPHDLRPCIVSLERNSRVICIFLHTGTRWVQSICDNIRCVDVRGRSGVLFCGCFSNMDKLTSFRHDNAWKRTSRQEESTSVLLATSARPLLFSGSSLTERRVYPKTENSRTGSRLCAAIAAYIVFFLIASHCFAQENPGLSWLGARPIGALPARWCHVSSPLTARCSKGICLSLSLCSRRLTWIAKRQRGGRAPCVMCKHIPESARRGRVWLRRPDKVVSLRQGSWVRIPPTMRMSRYCEMLWIYCPLICIYYYYY